MTTNEHIVCQRAQTLDECLRPDTLYGIDDQSDFADAFVDTDADGAHVFKRMGK